MRLTKAVFVLMVVLVLAAVAAAVPVTAFAQSAGDEQYVDPFQNQESGGSQGGGGNSGSQGGDGQTGTNTPPAETGQTTAEGAVPSDPALPAGSTASATTSEGGATLPRTGLPVALLAAMGGVLLGGGAVLRRRA
jgi:LPXTG-motif cell wall-anchored protein